MSTQPSFDRNCGWWTIRIRNGRGGRSKIYLAKDARWTKGGNWPQQGKTPRCPTDVQFLARPYQDQDTAARLGIEVAIPQGINQARFLDSYAASYAISRRPESSRLLRRAVASWTTWCDPRGILEIGRVTHADCRAYLESRVRSGVAYNTIRTERGLLGGAFRRAVDDRLIASNPWRRVEVPGRDESAGTPSYTAEEVARVAAELRGWHRDLWLVGVNCGFRCAALRGLRWADVRWSVPGREIGSLNCPARLSKSGHAYTVPLSGPLFDVLWTRYKKSGRRADDLVFPGRSADGGVSRATFGAALRVACKRAGVEYKGRPWHSMRATFASLCHAKGVNPRAIQAWMNHASIKMTDRYSRFSTEMEDAEAKKLE